MLWLEAVAEAQGYRGGSRLSGGSRLLGGLMLPLATWRLVVEERYGIGVGYREGE